MQLLSEHLNNFFVCTHHVTTTCIKIENHTYYPRKFTYILFPVKLLHSPKITILMPITID